MHNRIANESRAMSIEAPLFDHKRTASRRDLHHVLVPPAMLVAAVAMALASHLHLGFSFEIAMAIGISLFCLMLMSHVLLRAADEADRAAEERLERAIEQVSSPMPVEPTPRAEQERARVVVEAPLVAPVETASSKPVASAAIASVSPPKQPVPAFDPASAAPPLPDLAPIAEHLSRADTWSFRPQDLKQSSELPAAGLQAPAGAPGLGELRPTLDADGAGGTAGTTAPDGQRGRESDRIDAILKRLASQIHANAAERRGAEPVQSAPADSPAVSAQPSSEAVEQLAAADPDTALSSAVDALRSTVEAMRGSMEPAVAPAALPEPVAPTPATPVELRIAAVAEALAAERADVFLSPILGLGDAQARHFEVTAQLRAADGEPLDARQMAGGAGLLPLFDALNVRHAAGFALKLERRGRDGSVFSRVGGASLEDDQFVQDVAGRHAQGIADRMVLSFAQNEMRGLGPAQLAALGDLGRLGFRFALQGVADLDMDFEALNDLGFGFVKLDAQVFLDGLDCNGGHVPAADIVRHFEDLGLDVIVSGIGDAATRDRMVSCGVELGQGPLFGQPLPVPVAGPTSGTMAA